MYKTLMRGVPFTSLSEVTTGTGESAGIPTPNRNVRVVATGEGIISGGTILIELSDDPAFSGIWELLETITATDLTAGAKHISFTTDKLGAIRARVSANITGGGNATVEFTCD